MWQVFIPTRMNCCENTEGKKESLCQYLQKEDILKWDLASRMNDKEHARQRRTQRESQCQGTKKYMYNMSYITLHKIKDFLI